MEVFQQFITIALVFACIGVGIIEGRARTRGLRVFLTALALLAISNLWISLPFYSSDPTTWHITYFGNLLLTIVLLLAFYIVPFLASYFVARTVVRRGGHCDEIPSG